MLSYSVFIPFSVDCNKIISKSIIFCIGVCFYMDLCVCVCVKTCAIIQREKTNVKYRTFSLFVCIFLHNKKKKFRMVITIRMNKFYGN